MVQSRLVIDPARATLRNLVEDVLKDQLKYGDELSVNNEVGTVYDPDLDDNLAKKITDLGIKADSFLTVVDEEDDNPRVNLSLSISEKYVRAIPHIELVLNLHLSQNIARRLQSRRNRRKAQNTAKTSRENPFGIFRSAERGYRDQWC